MRRTDRLRQRHSDRQHHHLAKRSRARAFAADRGLVAQAEMNDAALPAAHGIEVERPLRLLHPLGRSRGAEPQFLDAHHAVVVGVETKPGVILRRHAQRFHGQKFERQQHFGLVSEQKLHFRTGEFHHHIRIFEIRMGVHALQDFVLDVHVHIVQYDIQELLDARARRGDRVFVFAHWSYTLVFFLGTILGAGAGGGGMVRLTIHCCKIPTKLLVNQYNTRPLDTL
jgi:hypothetical protein